MNTIIAPVKFILSIRTFLVDGEGHPSLLCPFSSTSCSSRAHSRAILPLYLVLFSRAPADQSTPLPSAPLARTRVPIYPFTCSAPLACTCVPLFPFSSCSSRGHSSPPLLFFVSRASESSSPIPRTPLARTRIPLFPCSTFSSHAHPSHAISLFLALLSRAPESPFSPF